MSIEIKRSIKPVDYSYAINLMEKRLEKVINNNANELIWFLEHNEIYTAGTSSKQTDILDKSIKIIKTSRGGRITCHSPGQLICYFVIDLNKRKRDIRKFLSVIENTIIETLKKYNINSFSDRKNVGIWVKKNNKTKKVAAIGIRVKKWVAYHGFSLNINNDLDNYKKIVPCGIKDKGVTNLKLIKNQNYINIDKEIISNFVKYLKTITF